MRSLSGGSETHAIAEARDSVDPLGRTASAVRCCCSECAWLTDRDARSACPNGSHRFCLQGVQAVHKRCVEKEKGGGTGCASAGQQCRGAAGGRARGSERRGLAPSETGGRPPDSQLFSFLVKIHPFPSFSAARLRRMRTCSALRLLQAPPTATAAPVRRAKPQSRKWQSEDSAYGTQPAHTKQPRARIAATNEHGRACQLYLFLRCSMCHCDFSAILLAAHPNRGGTCWCWHWCWFWCWFLPCRLRLSTLL